MPVIAVCQKKPSAQWVVHFADDEITCYLAQVDPKSGARIFLVEKAGNDKCVFQNTKKGLLILTPDNKGNYIAVN